MSEIHNILNDISSGALPASEIPGFVWWALRKAFWLCFAVIVIGGALLLTN